MGYVCLLYVCIQRKTKRIERQERNKYFIFLGRCYRATLNIYVSMYTTAATFIAAIVSFQLINSKMEMYVLYSAFSQ